MERLAIPFVVFPDVDAHQFRLAFPLQGKTFRRASFCFFSAGLTMVVSCISIRPVPTISCSFGNNSSTFAAVSMNSTLTGRRTDKSTRRSCACDDLRQIRQCRESRLRPRRHGKTENLEWRHRRPPVELLIFRYVDADFLTRPWCQHIFLLSLESSLTHQKLSGTT